MSYQSFQHTAAGLILGQRLARLDPAVAARVAQGGANLAHQLADPLALLQQGAANLLASTSTHLLLALTALLLAGWRSAQLHTFFVHAS